MIRGSAKFDGIAIGNISVDFLGPTLTMTCKAAFVDSTSGNTHGYTTGASWSPETIQKLKELKEAMERDLGRVHFAGEGTTTPLGASTTAEASGIGEHLADAPQL